MNKNCCAGQVVSSDSHNSFSGRQHDICKFVPLRFPISKAGFVTLNIRKFQILLELGEVSVFPNAV